MNYLFNLFKISEHILIHRVGSHIVPKLIWKD